MVRFSLSKLLFSFLLTGLILFFCLRASAQSPDSLTVKDIYISGNDLTREFVILREISLHKGDKVAFRNLNYQLRESEQFLINTSLFNHVNIRDSFSGTDLYLYIHVKERFPAIPDFQAKYGEANFTQWLTHPSLYRTMYGMALPIKDFRGRNETLTLSAIFGWRETFGIDYKIPYLNRQKTLGIEAIISYQQGHEVAAITDSNKLRYIRIDAKNIFHKTGFEADLIYRRKHQVTHTFTIGYDYYNIDDTVKKVNPDYLGNNRNSIKVPRLAYKLIYDKRDYAFYAQKGDYLMASIEQDGLPVILKDINVTTVDVVYRKFIPISKSFFYEGEIAAEYDLQKTLPYIFRSSLGYRYQVVGYEHYVNDGRAYAIAMNEIKFLAFTNTFHVLKKYDASIAGKFNNVPISLYFKVFTNQGAVFYNDTSHDNTLLNKLLCSYGIGADLITYYDKIIRVEYAFNILGQSDIFLHLTEVF